MTTPLSPAFYPDIYIKPLPFYGIPQMPSSLKQCAPYIHAPLRPTSGRIGMKYPG